MSIYQEHRRCWVLDTKADPTDHGDDDTRHLNSEAEARAVFGEDAPVVQLAGPCWLVKCDGDCEAIIDEEDECYIFHHEARVQAEETARAREWVLAPDAGSPVTMLAYCPEDAPAIGEVPLTPGQREAAGQQRLPGVPS